MQDYTKSVVSCHIVESSVYNSHAEFSKREANVVAHHLAKAIIYSASSQVYFDIPTCIYSSLFNEMSKFSFIKKT